LVLPDTDYSILSRPGGATPSVGITRERPRIATVLIGIGASGTERRMAGVFERLSRRHPGRHLLIVNRDLLNVLLSAGFRLEESDLHVLEYRSWFDRKGGAQSGLLTNLGRLATLLIYRREIARVCRSLDIGVVQVLLEMVPVLGLWPLPGVTQVASLVSHLPKYYDDRSFSSRLLKRSLRNYRHIDALYERIEEGLIGMGIPREKINRPAWSCVDHIRFHPEPKQDIVTFTGRAFAFKHPDLMLRAAELIHSRANHVRFYVLGRGPLMKRLIDMARRSGSEEWLTVTYMPDPSQIVNKSRVHVCIEEFDNATNQSLLEGLAAGCAIVASDVGYTSRVVTPDVGILVPLQPEAIADAVLSLINRPDGLDAMGQAARQKALRNYSIDRYLDYLTGMLNRNLPETE
jgi:glycosyltransferase involved in cell wall biosynthesis